MLGTDSHLWPGSEDLARAAVAACPRASLINPPPPLKTHEDESVQSQNEEPMPRHHQRMGSVSGAIAMMNGISANIAAAMSNDPWPDECWKGPRRFLGRHLLRNV
jgi:hypothetical protein